MKLTIEPTGNFVELSGDAPVRARIWRGEDENGGRIYAVIVTIAAASGHAVNDRLAEALHEIPAPALACAEPEDGAVEDAPAAALPAGYCGRQDPRAEEIGRVIAALVPSLAWLAARTSDDDVLGALATLYLRGALHHFGIGQTLAALDTMRYTLPEAAASLLAEPLPWPAAGKA